MALLRRFIDWLFPPHERIIRSYLAPDEVVILDDNPAIGEFLLVRAFWQLFFLGVLIVFSIWMFVIGHALVGALAFVVSDFIIVHLIWQRLSDYYTRYVITDLRIIRTSGVFNRTAYSIPFGKITDVAYKQKFWERRFGYATIEIDSASEKSGLDRLRGLKDPEKFNNVLVAMLADKQGYVVPGSAALNKTRSREDQLKLELRFGRLRALNFPDPDDAELARVVVAAVRDLQDKEDKLRHLYWLQQQTPEYRPVIAYPDEKPPPGSGPPPPPNGSNDDDDGGPPGAAPPANGDDDD